MRADTDSFHHRAYVRLLLVFVCALVMPELFANTNTNSITTNFSDRLYNRVDEPAAGLLPELPERFGNPILRGWHEITGPPPISWLPTAPGWRLLAFVLLLWLVRRSWLAGRLWWRNRYRREALRRLADSGQCPVVINEILKLAAMVASSRHEVAALSGDEWLNWLERRAPDLTLSDASRTLLAGALYGQLNPQPCAAFYADAEAWLRQHRDDHV